MPELRVPDGLLTAPDVGEEGHAYHAATAQAARAAPDEHTMLMVPSGFAANAGTCRKLPFDSVLDFSPVTLPASNPSILAMHPSLPFTTVKGLIAIVV